MANKRGQSQRGPKAGSKREPAFWRLSTITKKNIELAIEAKQWGTSKGIGMRTVKPGDEVAFYVSGWGRDAGYWGTAKVTSEPFVSHTPVWFDDVYPVRFKLAPDGPISPVRVTSEALKARLGGRRLKFLRQAGVISLTPVEYRAIAELLAAVRRYHVDSTKPAGREVVRARRIGPVAPATEAPPAKERP